MSMRSFALVVVTASLAVVSVASTASAEETAGATTLPITTIYGRRAKPSVIVEVSKARPEIKLADLQDPAVEKIVRAASKAPF
jgi:hypothetical protein